MAKSIVSGNLNKYGNAGQFETDRSTWGFDDFGGTVTRSLDQHTAGVSSALKVADASTQIMIPCRWPVVVGKKYILKAKVRTTTANPIGADAGLITLRDSLSNLWFIGVPFDIVETTILAAKDTWVDIEASVLATGPGIYSGDEIIYINLQFSVNYGGKLYVDQFEVYEYEDIAPPVCDLLIDVGSSVVTESTGADGTITIAHTGGTGTLEYSKDNGATWQSSNLFTGLAVGIYQCKVREVASPSCVDSYTFNVPASAYAFDFTTSVTDETVSGANNGVIEVTVTGVVAPFTFSKDAGATYQGSNIFTGLAPGTYTIVVKDAGGIFRAVNVTVGAGPFIFDKAYWSKNHIPFSLNAPSGWEAINNLRMYCDLRVEDVAGSSIYNSKIKMELYPSSDGVCVFNLRQGLRGVFSLNPPSFNSNVITKLTDRIKLFKKYTGQLQDLESTPASLTTSLPSLAMYGGLGLFAHASIDFFGSYLSANKKFLTWAPVEKTVDIAQEDYLNYFVFGIATATLKLQIKAYFDDGTNTTSVVQTKTAVQYGELYQIPAGPVNSGATAINPAKNLTKYELSLLDQADSLISEVRTYLISEITHPLTRFIMIVNSMGSHEVHRFTGEVVTDHEISKDTIQKYLAPVYSPTDGQFQGTESTYRARVNYSTGYITGKYGKEWKAYMTDLLLTRYFYDVSNGSRFPMMVTSNKMNAKEDHRYDHFVRFDAVSAYQDPAYTPDL